ncbi:MAG: hypothetical protein VKO39_00735 [Cyanobacteriota bacterium]|nr:hypothetical protein [Cyanobacteriota bacterium]
MTPSSSPTSAAAPSPGEASGQDLRQLLESLQDDRLWLLRQLDSGRWPEWRLDLAALERELGQLLDQASEWMD